MAEKKGSCLRRVMIGCGGCAVLFVLFGVVTTVVGLMTRSKPVEQVELEKVDSIAEMIEPSQRLGGDEPQRAKPVRLKLIAEMTMLEIRPSDQPGQIRVESDYDQANFELTTEAVDKGDHVEYEMRFRNKRTLLGMLLSDGGFDDDDIQNELIVYLPRDLLLSLDYDFNMGQMDMDLSGLAIDRLEGDFSMGRLDLRMSEPNQARIEQVRMDSSMGDVRLHDTQNLRYRNARFDHSMGELRVYHSGSYEADAEMRIDMTMGSARIYQPPETNIDQSMIAMLGESRTTRAEEKNPDYPTLKLSGKVTMGDIRTSRDTNQREINRLIRALDEGDLEAAVTEYKARIEANPRRALTTGQLNQAGYDLMNRRKPEAAIAVFELNVAIHPDYINGYDSLGDGYRGAGRLEEAAAAYRRALELDPGSGNNATRRKLARVEAALAETE